VVTGNTLDVQFADDVEFRSPDGKCGYTGKQAGPLQIVLESGGRAVSAGSNTLRLSTQFGNCGYPATWSVNFNAVGTWQVLE
jgi:hypothetical protein